MHKGRQSDQLFSEKATIVHGVKIPSHKMEVKKIPNHSLNAQWKKNHSLELRVNEHMYLIL